MNAPTQRRITAAEFRPTPEQIRAAENLFTAMAHEQLIRPIVEAYDAKILAKHQFRIKPEYVEQGVTDRVVLETKQSFLISDTDAAIFHAERNAARDAAGLKVDDPEHCPLLVAEDLRRKAEIALLVAMSATPGMDAFARPHTMTLNLRDKAVDLVLRLLAPFVGNGQEILRRIAA